MADHEWTDQTKPRRVIRFSHFKVWFKFKDCEPNPNRTNRLNLKP